MCTLAELKEKLSRFDEITLLELLDTNSEELVERFSDKIEDDIEKFQNAVKEDAPDQEEDD